MKQTQTKSLVIQNVELTDTQKKAIGIITPKDFIRERSGKGGKKFKYVETGYVVARLTQAFGPLGWSFVVKERIIEEKEVAVLGVLTFRANNGAEITKSQWGQAQRLDKMALGDALKSASSDALKKSASLLGVALDVYWPQLDMEVKETPERKVVKQETKKTEQELFEQGKLRVQNETNGEILRQWREKIEKTDVYTAAHKHQLLKLIDGKLPKNG